MKFRFSYLMLLMSLSVASIAGYYSVWGLSQLFAGASTAVIIMASILELAKVVTTTVLHRYWDKLSKGLKTYLTISVLVLMLITSVGVYGFLSNSYQITANKLEIHEGELSILTTKKTSFEKSIFDNEKIITTKNKRIDQLTNLRLNQETRLDSAKNNRSKDKVRNDIDIATKEIQKLSNDIDGLNIINNVLSDSVNKYNVKSLELKNGSDVARDIGPLKYISELTGAPMNKVVNYLILLIIFVFDPLAIALILATNKAFDLDGETIPQLIFKPINSKIKPNENIKEDIVEYSDNDIKDDKETEIIDKTEPWNFKREITQKGIEPSVEEPKSGATQTKKEPVITTGKIELKDIKEIKENKNRGYSVPVPEPDIKNNNNTIQRIGSNKVVKDGDHSKFFFKRKK